MKPNAPQRKPRRWGASFNKLHLATGPNAVSELDAAAAVRSSSSCNHSPHERTDPRHGIPVKRLSGNCQARSMKLLDRYCVHHTSSNLEPLQDLQLVCLTVLVVVIRLLLKSFRRAVCRTASITLPANFLHRFQVLLVFQRTNVCFECAGWRVFRILGYV